jgi:hypothetical protein
MEFPPELHFAEIFAELFWTETVKIANVSTFAD